MLQFLDLGLALFSVSPDQMCLSLALFSVSPDQMCLSLAGEMCLSLALGLLRLDPCFFNSRLMD